MNINVQVLDTITFEELAWLPPFPAAIDVVGGRTPPRCDPRALCAALFRLGDGRRTAVLAKADFTDYLAAMLECYFAESPAAAIAAMGASIFIFIV